MVLFSNVVWQYFQTQNTFQVVPFHIDLGCFANGGFSVKIIPEMLLVILFISFTHGSAEYSFVCCSELRI